MSNCFLSKILWSITIALVFLTGFVIDKRSYADQNWAYYLAPFLAIISFVFFFFAVKYCIVAYDEDHDEEAYHESLLGQA